MWQSVLAMTQAIFRIFRFDHVQAPRSKNFFVAVFHKKVLWVMRHVLRSRKYSVYACTKLYGPRWILLRQHKIYTRHLQ